MPQLILIYGMHRSGTSALAGFFNHVLEYNLPIGPIIPANSLNPKGHFESVGLVEMNDEILTDHGHTWDNPGFIEAKHLYHYSAEILDYIRKSTDKSVVIKDPRITLLTPAYFTALEELLVHYNYNVRAYKVTRPTAEIVASLRKRNGFTEEKAFELVQQYLNAERRHRLGMKAPAFPVTQVWYKDMVEWFKI